MIVRSKDFLDNATPSGNSVALLVLLKLSQLTGNDDYRRRAIMVLRLIANQMQRYPSAFGLGLCGLDFYLSTPKEIVIVGTEDDPQLPEFLTALWQRYLPNRVISRCTIDHERAAGIVQIVRGRIERTAPLTAYVCEANTCQIPALTAHELANQLSPVRAAKDTP